MDKVGIKIKHFSLIPLISDIIFYRYRIASVRKTLTEMSQEAYLGPDKELLLK